MKQHEYEALKKLGVPMKKWGDDYRVKVRGKTGRYVYVSNISKTFYAQQIAKQYPKAFKTKDVKEGVKKLKQAIYDRKPKFHVWDKQKHKKGYLFEHYPTNQLFGKLEDLMRSQNKAFKMNLQLGYNLIDIETGEERYWSPGHGTYVFDEPIQINSRDDINGKIMSKLRETDFASKVKYPSSGYKLQEIVAFHTTIFPLNHRLGDDKIEIPKVISDNRHIVNYPKTENKCIFYCIAGFMNPKKDYRYLNTPVKNLFKQYCAFKGIEFTLPFYRSFEGVDIFQFDELEECFQLNINVFEMDLETETISIMRQSTKAFEKAMNVLDYEGHAMYIPRPDKLEGKFICDRCDQCFASGRKLADHKRNKCDVKVLESFESKLTVYTPPENQIKKLLRKYGVKDVDHYLDHFIVYDFEAILKPIDDGPSEDTRFVSEHRPVSVSVCDSLTNEVKCFVSEDIVDLLKQMFDYIDSVSTKIFNHNQAKFESLISVLRSKMDKLREENPDILEGVNFANLRQKLRENPKLREFWKKIGGFATELTSFEKCIEQVPLIGFNSSRYDINLIKKEMIAVLGPNEITSVIKNPGYMCIATNSLKIMDITNYLPAGTSYDSYLRSYLGECMCEDKITCVCGLGKGLFPYEYITSFDKLDETELPPREAFDSKFKNTTISDDDYERIKFVWSHYGMQSIKDLLVWYNNLDVVPFVKAIIEQRKFYRRYDLDMLHDGLSLPGLAEKIMYQTSHKEMLPIKPKWGKKFDFPQQRLVGYQKQDKDAERKFDLSLEHVNELLSKQYFSCTYCRCALTEENASADRINNKLGHIDGNIVMSCTPCNVARKNMNMAAFRYQKKLEYNADRLVYSIDVEQKDIYFKMKANIAGGPSIIFSRYAESGVSKIRQYLLNGKQNPNAKTCKKVIGYDANALYLWALGNVMPCGRLTTIDVYEGIVEDIKSDILFGFLECDIETPGHLKEYFSEMTPIFKNVEIDPTKEEVIGAHMSDYNNSLGKMMKKTKQRKLIGSYFGHKILIYTPLLKWYLDHGMVITNMYSFIKASKHTPFKTFADDVSNARREGDESLKSVAGIMYEKLPDSAVLMKSTLQEIIETGILEDERVDILSKAISKELVNVMSQDDLKRIKNLFEKLRSLRDSKDSKEMIANMMKLVGNAAFGRSGMDKSKHKLTKFASDEDVDKLKEKPEFIDLDELDGACEVSMRKRRIKFNNPIHLSIAIYQLAKLRMLEFYYDCIDFYFDRSDFQYVEMDTDSAYMAFSDENPFENIIKPELRDHFKEHKSDWFPRDNTKETAAYDKRTPGLFKEEWRGNGIYALAAKNYICFNPDVGNKLKISSKGVQGSNDICDDKKCKKCDALGGNCKTIRNGDALCSEAFKSVCEDKVSIKATNKGFRVNKTTQRIITYGQLKTGLSYYYDKRQVLSDGISTIPLPI